MEDDQNIADSKDDQLGGFSPLQIFLSHIFNGGTVAQLEGRTPESLDALHYVAVNLYNSKRYKEAHPVFHELVRLNHLEPRYMFGLAACLHKMERYVNAANVYLSSILLDPASDNIEAHFYIAECLISANQSLDEVHKYLQYVVDKCPKKGPLADMRSIAKAKLNILSKSHQDQKGEVLKESNKKKEAK